MSPTQSEGTTHTERDGEDTAAAPPRPSRRAPAGAKPDGPGEPRGDVARRGEGQRGRRGGAV